MKKKTIVKKKKTQKVLGFKAGVNIESLEKDITDVIEKHGTLFPVGTNMFQEVGPKDLKDGFFLIFLKKEDASAKGVKIKRMTFGSGLTLLELSESFERTLEELFRSSNQKIGRA